MKRFLSTASAVVALGLSASAQAQLPFPMQVDRVDPGEGTVTARPDYAAMAALLGEASVDMPGVYLPGGRMVDLSLERIDLARRKFGFFVDGQPRADLLDDLELSVWKGTVAGEADSEVLLSFSRRGTRGWIRSQGDLVHLMPTPDAAGDWEKGSTILVTEVELIQRGNSLGEFCGFDQARSQNLGEFSVNPPNNSGQELQQGQQLGGQLGLGTCTLREATLAVETDYQLYQIWGDLGAETAYVTTLLAAGSDRYETQIETVLTFPYVQFYTSPNDPWSAQDGGGNSVDVLYEFQAAWSGNVPMGADLGHFLSGAGLGGGVAWLDVLCNDEFNFGVSGNIDGLVNFPVQQGPTNWDFMVWTHEVGHNFSSPHTHDYCPPIDQCAPNGYFGQCQTTQQCTNQGTIMGYCHLCSGGLSNVTLFFHPTVVNQMKSATQNCLPLYSGISATVPDVLSPTATTQVSAEIVGGVVGNVDLNYRYSGGAWSAVQMTNTTGNTYVGDLPAAACGDTPEFYISFNSAACGPTNEPVGGASAPFTALVGTEAVAFADDFESDQGWTATNLGASSGDWQRGVPVNDGGWAYDPVSDGDGSGSAYLTQNQSGNTDVDNGAVRLLSPVIDMSGSNVLVSYRYYLYLTNTDGTDRLLVEASSNGTSGPWTTIAVHDTDGGTSWRSHSIDMTTAGVALTANMRLRFTANDDGTQSIVEAGLDGFEVTTLSCDGGGGVTAYCDPANANSVSPSGASLVHAGGAIGGNLDLTVTGVPNSPGIFFYGATQGDQPFGCGRRCVVGQVQRTGVFLASGNQVQASFSTSGASTPLNVQYWYRDTANQASCGNSFNTSNALNFQ